MNSHMMNTNPISYTSISTPLIFNTTLPFTPSLFHPSQPISAPNFTNSLSSPQLETIVPEIPPYHHLTPTIQFIPHPIYPHIPIPVMAPPNQNIANSPLHPQNFGSPLQQTNLRNTNPHQNLPLPRLEFPEFNGTNPRSWLNKCERYFQLHQIPEN